MRWQNKLFANDFGTCGGNAHHVHKKNYGPKEIINRILGHVIGY
jgi:hypothetical protein